MEGYAVSAQCMALVRDHCLVPTKDAPELGYVRESSDKQFVPDVYYKVSDLLIWNLQRFKQSKKTIPPVALHPLSSHLLLYFRDYVHIKVHTCRLFEICVSAALRFRENLFFVSGACVSVGLWNSLILSGGVCCKFRYASYD